MDANPSGALSLLSEHLFDKLLYVVEQIPQVIHSDGYL